MVKKLRELTGLSQVKFGEYLGIPRRTIENWESGVNEPPQYVLDLIEEKVNKDYAPKNELETSLERGNIGTVVYFMRKKLQEDLELLLKEKGLEDPEVNINYELILKGAADDKLSIEIRDWKEDDTANVLRFETASIDMIFKDRMMDVAVEILNNGIDNVGENKQLWAGIHSPSMIEI